MNKPRFFKLKGIIYPFAEIRYIDQSEDEIYIGMGCGQEDLRIGKDDDDYKSFMSVIDGDCVDIGKISSCRREIGG